MQSNCYWVNLHSKFSGLPIFSIMEKDASLTAHQHAENIIERWNAGQTSFKITTSGSTGLPKTYILEKPSLIWSANQTLKHFISTPNKQLICLPLNKVGGFMQIIRSLVWKQPFYQIEPSSNPLLDETIPDDCKIASFTPHQLYHILHHDSSKKKLAQFQSVLVGGGEISVEIEKQLIREYPKIQFVHTFGMTETYSHFAGRLLGEVWYHLTDNTQIQTNPSGCLQVRNTLTNNEWLTTNDLIQLDDKNQQFKWLGRADFTINSGGVKIQIESVEKQIGQHLNIPNSDFFCWGLSHESLGQELTLFVLVTSDLIQTLIESRENQEWDNPEGFIRDQLNKKIQSIRWVNPYEKPRRIEFVHRIYLTETQKINRKETVSQWLKP